MTALWWPVIAAAAVSAAISLIALWWNSRQARLDRRRELFGRAFAAVAAYREFAYIVRRRDDSDEARTVINRDLSKVQAALHHHEALVRVEAPKVAEHYSELIRQARFIAGDAIRKGWDAEPARSDAHMHIKAVDLAPLGIYENQYLLAVQKHLSLRSRVKLSRR